MTDVCSLTIWCSSAPSLRNWDDYADPYNLCRKMCWVSQLAQRRHV